MNNYRLIGPFRQLLTLDGLPLKGALCDDHLDILPDAGILIHNGIIDKIAPFKEFNNLDFGDDLDVEILTDDYCAMPGMIDAHTHICFEGSRAMDYAMRLSGKSYLEIASCGGGIHSTVINTNDASFDTLLACTRQRAITALNHGITTLEIKSGYGLNVEAELKMLRVIHDLDNQLDLDIVGTCLAAHTLPAGFNGTSMDYLKMILKELLPRMIKEKLSNRVDIFIEKSAFGIHESEFYLTAAKLLGFDIVVHADQFSIGGSELAVSLDALSADHLEASTSKEIELLAKSNTVAVCLPGASLGLGEPYAPARKLLNAGASLAIASDWNPGSAPMGDLLLQASVMAIAEKLSMTETLSAITYRAAKALNLTDRGILKTGKIADVIAFPTRDYRDILYFQGGLKPGKVWKKGILQQ